MRSGLTVSARTSTIRCEPTKTPTAGELAPLYQQLTTGGDRSINLPGGRASLAPTPDTARNNASSHCADRGNE